MNAQAKIRQAGYTDTRMILNGSNTIGYTASVSGLYYGFNIDGEVITDPYMNRGMATRQAKRKI